MKTATIHRNSLSNQWVVLTQDTIREKKGSFVFDSLAEAEAAAIAYAGDKVKVVLS